MEPETCEDAVENYEGMYLCKNVSCPYKKDNQGIKLLVTEGSEKRLPLCLSEGMKPLDEKLETKNG